MRTKYGSYEFLVLLFAWLCNEPSTFTTFMNLIFHNKLNKFIIINVVDILIYLKSVEKHCPNLYYVLQKL